MICLRCGYCCLMYDVIIVNDINKPIDENNCEHKPNNKRCPHLVGNEIGKLSCGIHEFNQKNNTPCAQYSQVEDRNTNCRTGNYLTTKQNELIIKKMKELLCQ